MSSKEDGTSPRIPRVAKGQRQQHFGDPDIDTLVGVVVSLVGEVSVLRDRVETLERALEERGVVTRAAVAARPWSPEETLERAASRAAYLERVLRAVSMEAEDLSGGRVARPLEDIVADLAAGRF
jgi:hypothetical protein